MNCHLTCWPPVVTLPSLCYLDYMQCPCLLMAAHHPLTNGFQFSQARPQLTKDEVQRQRVMAGSEPLTQPRLFLIQPVRLPASRCVTTSCCRPCVSDSHKSNSPFHCGKEYKKDIFVLFKNLSTPCSQHQHLSLQVCWLTNAAVRQTGVWELLSVCSGSAVQPRPRLPSKHQEAGCRSCVDCVSHIHPGAGCHQHDGVCGCVW